MEHLQRSGLFNGGSERRTRDRLVAQADKILSAACLSSSRGAKGRGAATAPSPAPMQMPTVSLSAAQECAAHAQRAAVRQHEEEPRRTVSMTSIASSASLDDAHFHTIVAAFPQPPSAAPLQSPAYVAWRKGSFRATALPPAGPPPAKPLPLPPTASSGRPVEVKEVTVCEARCPPSYPLPPVPSSVPLSKAFTDVRSLTLQVPVGPPASPTTSASSPFSFSPFTSSAVPSPSAPDFARYQLPTTHPRSSDERQQLQPLHSGLTTIIPDTLARFAFPPSLPHVAPSGTIPEIKHISLSRGHPIPSSSSTRPRTRTESTASSTSFASGTSRSSLQIENITADLSQLVESIRRTTPAGGAAKPDRDKREDEREEQEGRLLLRGVQSAAELHRRNTSVASSSSGSTGTDVGSIMTPGGYRAYKLRRRPSLILPHQARFGHNSRRSSGSSNASSEEEELFDPPSTRLGGSRYGRCGRRKSSATSVDSMSEMVKPSKSDEGTNAVPIDTLVGGEGVNPPAVRRCASSDGHQPPSHRVRPPLSPRPSLLSLAPRGISASHTLNTTHSTPALRRPSLALPAASLAVAPVSARAPMVRKRSFGASPAGLPTVAEPDSEAELAAPGSPAPSTGSRRRPLVRAASSSFPTARIGASSLDGVVNGPRLAVPRQKPLALAPASSSSAPPLVPALPTLRSRKSALPGASSAPDLVLTAAAGAEAPCPVRARKTSLPSAPSLPVAMGARAPLCTHQAQAHGEARRQSLSMLPYLSGGAVECAAGSTKGARLPRR